MFRIGVQDENESATLTIEGTLSAPVAAELERCWQTTIAGNPDRPIIVKLAAVTFVDSECRDLLTRMRRSGVTLVPTGCLMKSIVERIDAEIAGAQNARDDIHAEIDQ
jgi:anti-anti-sigma regulatory factor